MSRQKRPYTQAEFRRFKRLVEMAESRVQMERIKSRLQMPAFVEEVGKEKCDIMFKRLCGAAPPRARVEAALAAGKGE